jgi:pyridoxamine 5'-phosphate oxidase
MSTDRDGAFSEDPMVWFLHAQQLAAAQEAFDVTRAALATATVSGEPAVRFVLVKQVDHEGFRFFTNYESEKARDLDANPRAALAFHWHTLGMQVRVQGSVQRVSAVVSDAYFATRPRVSQLGAWASAQSRSIGDRAALDARLIEAEQRFAGQPHVPRPAHWGGYCVAPERIEIWQDKLGRLHDRWLFTRDGLRWVRTRLQP